MQLKYLKSSACVTMHLQSCL